MQGNFSEPITETANINMKSRKATQRPKSTNASFGGGWELDQVMPQGQDPYHLEGEFSKTTFIAPDSYILLAHITTLVLYSGMQVNILFV